MPFFSNLFIVCQTRELDLDMFFKHENQAFPPTISKDGDLYPTQKSNIVSLLESYCDVEYIQPLAEEIIIDGSAFVYSLSPQAGTFSEYCKQTFAEKNSPIQPSAP